MIDTMGIILTGDDDMNINELTRVRSVAALPMAGRYRLIDFMLSNMVNSGISNVGVATKSKYRSLMDHLGSGKEWDLSRKVYGLKILPPYLSNNSAQTYGDIDILNGILDYLGHSKQKYVVLASGDLMINTVFDELKEFHIKNKADITIMYNEEPTPVLSSLPKAVLATDEDSVVIDMEAYSTNPAAKKRSLGIYFMEKDFLELQIRRCISRGLHDFVMDVLVHNLTKYRIMAYKFEGYVGRVDSIASYYSCNMDMLDGKKFERVFGDISVYTKVKDEVPTIYGEDCVVKNSLIADGCIIHGTVENCIIFRGVSVKEGAVVKNSIIMQNAEINDFVNLDYVILDKSVVVRKNKTLIGQESFPLVIGKKIIV